MNILDMLTLATVIFIGIGLLITWRKSFKQNDVARGGETARNVARDIRVDNLPCQVDPLYMIRQGQMLQKAEDIQLRLHRIEHLLDDRKNKA